MGICVSKEENNDPLLKLLEACLENTSLPVKACK
jgi:hypothetical protein